MTAPILAKSTPRQWLRLLAEGRASLVAYLVPGLLMLAASAFEGLSVVLLVPTLEGLLTGDFSRATSLPVVGAALRGPLSGVAKSDGVLVAVLLGAIATAVLLKVATFFSGRVLFAARGVGLTAALRERLLRRFLGLGKRFFDDNNAGHLQEILLVHTRGVGEGAVFFGIALNQVFTIAVFGALMLWLSWPLTLAVGALVPVLYLSLGRLVARVREQSDQNYHAQRRLSELTFNLLSCLPLVKANHQEAFEAERFGARSAEVARFEHVLHRWIALVGPIHELLLLAFVVVAVLVVTRFPPAAPANVLVFFYVLKRTSTHVNDLNHMRAELARLSGSVKVVLDGLTDPDKPVVQEGAREFTGLQDRLELDRLTFAYGEGAPPALREVSFEVRRGTTTAIVGRTGSGKSTFVSLLLRFYDVGPDMIRLDGVDIREFTHRSIRSRIAFVPQDCQLFNGSVHANLTYGLEREVPPAELTEVLRAAKLADLIERLPKGLDAEVGDRGVKLSGGEKQRLALARALLKRAEILILDEATSSLDSRTEQLVQEAIDECLTGRTAIVVAHRLATIQHADQIVLIEDGVVVEKGTLDELLAAHGPFHAYWEAQRYDRERPRPEPAPRPGLAEASDP